MTNKLIPSDISYNVADSLFDQGKVAMFIDGAWDVAAHRKALGKNFAAVSLPAVSGCAAPRPFLSTQMAFVNSYSPQGGSHTPLPRPGQPTARTTWPCS